jgi:hypothetical protein
MNGGVQMEDQNKWTYEYCGREIWNTGEFFESRELAIKAGTEFAKEEGLESFEIGKKEEYEPCGIDVDSIFEAICCDAQDSVGEVSENYLCYVSEDHRDELEEKLNEVLFEWMDKHKYRPEFWSITECEIIEVEK